MNYLNITLFASTTPQGQELSQMLKQSFNDKILADRAISFKVMEDGDQEDMSVAGLRDDIVIFDASIEDKIGLNYKALQMWPSTMEHFLVVSRTRLPLNFLPYHEGGTPDLSGRQIEHSPTLDNHSIINWIHVILAKMEDHLPRSENKKMDIKKGQLVINQNEFQKLSEEIIISSTNNKGKYRKSQGRAFISYLSCYSKSFKSFIGVNNLSVEDLSDYIKEFHNDHDYPVFYFGPGALTSEFMTMHRHWQVLSIIDWRIRDSDELWIFESDDYYNSWWTLAELASLVYIRHGDKSGVSHYKLPKIYLCKPTRNGFFVTEAPVDYVQDIDPVLAREFGRFLSNSDPLTMGYEGISNMQKLQQLPMPLQWLAHKTVGFITNIMMAHSPIYQDMKNTEDKDSPLKSFSRYREMINSKVFTDSFWNDRIVTCKICKGENNSKNNFNFERFLSHNLQGQYKVNQKDMQKILDSRLWKCKICGTQFNIIEESQRQFRWWPVRVGQPTGPDGVYLEELPVYSITL
ncbi:MAG: hypothetical protein NTX45_22440 [Proteobacteria bacterium]|nr:hypothetical protein [Pseudomonadota bacterium]